STQDVEVGTLSSNDSSAVFTPIETVDLGGGGFQKFAVSFANYAGTDMYIGIRRLSTATYTDVYLDNIAWEPIPACVEPSGVMHSNITGTGAQLDWTAPSSSSPVNYHIYLSTSNAAPTASTAPTDSATGTTFTWTTLNSATQYFVWV